MLLSGRGDRSRPRLISPHDPAKRQAVKNLQICWLIVAESFSSHPQSRPTGPGLSSLFCKLRNPRFLESTLDALQLPQQR